MAVALTAWDLAALIGCHTCNAPRLAEAVSLAALSEIEAGGSMAPAPILGEGGEPIVGEGGDFLIGEG